MKSSLIAPDYLPPLVVTASEMQTMDRQTIETFGLPGQVLMENAGRGATRFFLESVYPHAPGNVAVAAGRGNNGGDGFVIARYLSQMGIPVTVYLLAKREQVMGDAAANLKLLEPLNVEVIEIAEASDIETLTTQMAHADCWVDALLGTGLNSRVRGKFALLIDLMNSFNRPVLAVDIPSGLSSDTGQVWGTCIRATATATFAFAKIGHLVTPGAQYVGKLRVIDIGIPGHIVEATAPAQHVIDKHLIERHLAPRAMAAHKGTFGHVLVAAGAIGKTGAAAMAAKAALRAGAGLVTLACPATVEPVLAAKMTEIMTAPIDDQGQGYFCSGGAASIMSLAENKTCLALGPGIGTDPATIEMVGQIIESSATPLVVDADGLNCLAAIGLPLKAKAPVILTPHPGEMARLAATNTAAIQADRVTAARQLALSNQAVVALKGARTIVACPDGKCGINLSGNPGMASGGMGDVLTGLIAGFVAQGLTAQSACHTAVWIHGMAADRLALEKGPWGYTAGEVMQMVPRVIAGIVKKLAN